EIVEVVYHFHKHDPQRVQTLQKKIKRYVNDIERLNLKDHLLSKSSNGGSFIFDGLKTLTTIIVGFPFFLFGVINNFIAYKIPDFLASLSSRPDFYGSITMATGMVTFIVFYSLQIWLVASFTPGESGWWITIAYAVSLPITGIIALYYWRYLEKIRGRWLFIFLFYRKSSLITRLINQREDIVKTLEKGKKDYLNLQNSTV
ncbi:MAG: hypothetical protein IIA88_10685, partial [Bacteroidetes bacterium]|nr:hypothetical protein [Bacteroidota bacterium]